MSRESSRMKTYFESFGLKVCDLKRNNPRTSFFDGYVIFENETKKLKLSYDDARWLVYRESTKEDIIKKAIEDSNELE